MNSWILTTAIAAIIGTALVGGIFFAFSTFIMKALEKIAPAEGIRAMQSINLVVLNPLFLGAFMGTPIICIAATILAIISGSSSGLPYWFALGSLSYVLGTFFVTALGNVPLNDRLADAKPESAEGLSLWQSYLKRWTLFNHIRTGAALAAALCFIIGLLKF
ncbi:MAG: anthrone oxygenase family protein [Verrucomicrobiota bacterium]